MESASEVTDDEDAEEVARERYRELLEELRTIMPGAQVLLAFLLTVPFAGRFAEVDATGKGVFTASLVCVAIATVLFLGPAAYHRVSPRRNRRERLHYGVRVALTGLILLGVSIALAVFVVVRFMYGTSFGASLAAVVAGTSALMWFVIPVLHRRRFHQS